MKFYPFQKRHLIFTFITWSIITGIQMIGLSQVERSEKTDIEMSDKFLEAQVYQYMGRWDNAIEKYLELLRLHRNNATIAFELSKCYQKTGDAENSARYAEIAIQTNDENVWILKHYSDLMFELENFEKAATGYFKLSQLEGSNYIHIENYGKALINARKFDQVVRDLNQWEKAHKIYEPLIRMKFDIHLQTNNKTEAEKELLKLVNAYPVDLRYMNNLAAFYGQHNMTKKATEWYEKILELDPNDARANTAMMSLSKGKIDDTHYIRSLKSLIANKNIDPDHKVLEIIPYVQRLAANYDHQISSALVEITEILSLTHPENPKCLAIYGDALYLNDQLEEASQVYIKTLQREKKIYQVWQQLLTILEVLEDYTRLEKYSLDAIDFFPNQNENYYFLGIAMMHNNKFKEAREYLEEGLMMTVNDWITKVKLLTALAKNEFASNHIHEALKYAEEAINLSQEKDASSLELMGDIQAKMGQIERAHTFWKLAVKAGANALTIDKKLNQ
ncbi:MAG TPA: tetratricopeptide repeat protein [Saprospiraceae bacterium]|nr:tetratricopeptide repeat protein [Saprospiraceae bacterium]